METDILPSVLNALHKLWSFSSENATLPIDLPGFSIRTNKKKRQSPDPGIRSDHLDWQICTYYNWQDHDPGFQPQTQPSSSSLAQKRGFRNAKCSFTLLAYRLVFIKHSRMCHFSQPTSYRDREMHIVVGSNWHSLLGIAFECVVVPQSN